MVEEVQVARVVGVGLVGMIVLEEVMWEVVVVLMMLRLSETHSSLAGKDQRGPMIKWHFFFMS